MFPSLLAAEDNSQNTQMQKRWGPSLANFSFHTLPKASRQKHNMDQQLVMSESRRPKPVKRVRKTITIYFC